MNAKQKREEKKICHEQNKHQKKIKMKYSYFVCLIICIIVLVILLKLFFENVITIRNESEYHNIVEHQTTLVADILKENPNILPTIKKLRYFPDKSGYFIVLDFSGKILIHGEYDGDLNGSLPFELPVKSIIEIAKNGGGYLKFNYMGFLCKLFVYAAPNSSFIICSGIYTDAEHINDRIQMWKRQNKILPKKCRHNVIPK